MTRKEALRAYFVEVVKDLVKRGIIRRASGQTLEQILAAESDTIIREIRQDFTGVFMEMGFGLFDAVLGAGKRMGLRLLEDLFASK